MGLEITSIGQAFADQNPFLDFVMVVIIVHFAGDLFHDFRRQMNPSG